MAGPSKQPTKPGEKHAHFSLEAVSHGIDRQAADQRPGSTPASRATAAEASTPSKQSGSSANPAARSTTTISLKKPPSASDSQAASARADPFVVLPRAPTKVKDSRASRTTGPKSAKPATARESGPLHIPVKFKSYVPGGAGREADAAAATKAAPSSALGGASQNDPIISFSSPTSSDARGPAGKRRDDREEIDNVDSSASQGQGAGNRINHTQSAAPTAASSGEVIENESGVRLQERFINGKTIMVAITESMSTAGSIPVPETQEARPPLQPDYFVDDLLSVAHEMMAGHPGAVESATGADAEATMPVLPLEQVSEEMQGMVDEESSIVDTSTDHSGSLNPDQTAADSRDQSGSPMAVENQTPVSARPGSTSEPIVRGLKNKVIESPPQMTVVCVRSLAEDEADHGQDPRAFQQASSAAASPTLSPHQVPAPAEADSSDVVQNVRQLRQSNEDLLEKCQSLTSDNEFLRKQYTLASDRAMEEVQRTEALEATIAQLRQQLKYGLKQRELHVDAIKSQRSAENTRLRAQMHILLQQSRLTDDAVRKKAARFSEMALRNAQLEKQQAQHAEQLQALEERNEELLEQIEMLRANQLGVLDDSDDEGEVDGDDDSTADSDLETEAPHGRRKANGSPEKRDADGDAVMRDGSPAQARRPLQSAPAAAPTPSSVEVKSSQPVPARTAPPQPVTSFLTDGEGVQLDRPVFGCRNHVAGEACKAVFATKAVSRSCLSLELAD